MLARKFASYGLHMAGITHKEKCLILIVIPQVRKNVSQITSKWWKEKKKKNEEKINMKK